MSSRPVDRTEELAAALAGVRERIASACAAVGRDPAEITLVAVTKTFPAADVVRLASLGVRDIGENRDQEAAPKAAEVAAAGATVRWHFVGRLQRNKCRSVARYAHAVHSVDRIPLADELAAALAQAPGPSVGAGPAQETAALAQAPGPSVGAGPAQETAALAQAPGPSVGAGPAQETRQGRALDVLLQVSLDGDPARGGCPPAELASLADAVAARPPLRLAGVMAVAPLDWAPERAFALLADVAGRLREDHPGATAISAGMSHDLEAAIAHGATLVRIGSALLGNRPKLR